VEKKMQMSADDSCLMKQARSDKVGLPVKDKPYKPLVIGRVWLNKDRSVDDNESRGLMGKLHDKLICYLRKQTE